MLQKNPLCPPLPEPPNRGPTEPQFRPLPGTAFLSAEDFDATGLFSGMDPCESRYWWMPELYGPELHGPENRLEQHPSAGRAAQVSRFATGQAANRGSSPTTAAA